jgi:acetyltransferase-like isoleucine patch superfamily enzyme
LIIGDDTFVGHDCKFQVADSIRIGNHTYVAGSVSVRDFDGHPVDAIQRRAKEPTPPEGIRPVVIGEDVWIGAGAVILKGVTVGSRSVVAAMAVVTKDVPADAVVAGNPARVIKLLAGQQGGPSMAFRTGVGRSHPGQDLAGGAGYHA